MHLRPTAIVLTVWTALAPWPLSARQRLPAGPGAERVIGYYADWTARRYPLAGIPASKLTHVNYAFGEIGPDHRLTFNRAAALETVYAGDCAEPGCAHGLFDQITVVKQKAPHLKFLLSVGGWTDSGPFYAMAASATTRRSFAESCAEFLRTYPQFDGIDVDWEHPVIGGVERGQPRDAENYVRLLAALREAIGPDRLLTVAVSASPRGIAPLDYAGMVQWLDWVSVMAYDFHSGNARRAGYNAALYNNADPRDPRLNTHDASRALLAKGVPRSKLVVGVPFFGKGWTGVESPDPWSAATATGEAGGYRTIVERYLGAPGYVRYWDDVAKVPRLYNAERKHWISYDDPESMRLKGEYIAAQQLGGAMFWELSHDNGELLDALRAGMGLTER
jgi:chitinase